MRTTRAALPLCLLTPLLLCLLAPLALAAPRSALPQGVVDHYFLSSDGVRLHYLEAGPPAAHTIIFVPGWTMPAWIWMSQIQVFSRAYHVVAFDPRGQGDSAIPQTGYEPVRRGFDIADLERHIGAAHVVIVAWSLGVLDTLASIHVAGDRRLAGLVLVDNSVGEEPPPTPVPVSVASQAFRHHRHDPEAATRRFVASMFEHRPPPGYIERLTQASLRMPEPARRLLLAYPEPRSYWKEAIYSTAVPTLYVVRPRWLAQAENLVRNRPHTEMALFKEAGHALFVDEPARFNSLMERFLRTQVWP